MLTKTKEYYITDKGHQCIYTDGEKLYVKCYKCKKPVDTHTFCVDNDETRKHFECLSKERLAVLAKEG